MTALEPAPALTPDPAPAPESGAAALDPAVAAQLAALDAAAADHLDPRPHTADAYAADWRAWHRFLADFNAALRESDPDCPQIPDTATNFGLFVAFVGWHRGNGLAPATIRRRVYGVTVTQRRRGITVPPESTAAALRAITAYTEDLARDKQRDPRGRGRGKAAPAQVRHLRRIGAHLTGLDTLAAVRDHAVVLVGFAIGSRRSELAHLDVDDIEITDEGMIVHVRYGKSGARDDAVPYGTHPTTCPVRTALAWIDELRLADRADGPLFLPIDRHGNLGEHRLSPAAIGDIVTRTGERARIGVTITGHSLRSGMATEARRAGHDVETIAAQGGWKPGSPVLYEYLHKVDRWAENALQGVGLQSAVASNATATSASTASTSASVVAGARSSAAHGRDAAVSGPMWTRPGQAQHSRAIAQVTPHAVSADRREGTTVSRIRRRSDDNAIYPKPFLPVVSASLEFKEVVRRSPSRKNGALVVRILGKGGLRTSLDH